MCSLSDLVTVIYALYYIIRYMLPVCFIHPVLFMKSMTKVATGMDVQN